jgi:hypothetical protein
VEGTIQDDQAKEWPFHIRRYLLPTGWEIDLRISPLGISIDTTNLTQGIVKITFEVQNRGNMEVNDTVVEVFSVHSAYKASGFPTYGSPYLWELFNTTVSLPVNGSQVIAFDVSVKDLYRRGVMVVVDPDNAMPETPVENNMATSSLPDDVTRYNQGPPSSDDPEGASLNLGFVAIMVAAIIFVVLVIVALLVLKND